MSNVLPFSSAEYDKLQYSVFPTIRRRDKYGSVGTVNEIVAGQPGDRRTLGRAEVIAKEKTTISDINNQLLMYDTDTSNYTDAIALVNSFYSDEIDDNEELTLYWSKWIDRKNHSLTQFGSDSK